MNNVVAFPSRQSVAVFPNMPVVVSVADADGTKLLVCPVAPSGDDSNKMVPGTPYDRDRTRAALRYALALLDGA